jgi:hypothetical protein
VQTQLEEAAESVIADLHRRFPKHDVLDAFSIVHPNFYIRNGTFASFERHLKVLMEHFGGEKHVNGTVVPAVVDALQLQTTSGWFYDFALHTAKRRFVCHDNDRDLTQIGAGAASSDDEDDNVGETQEHDDDHEEVAAVLDGSDHDYSDAYSSDGSDAEETLRQTGENVPSLPAFWQALTACSAYAESKIGAFAKLAEILVVVVGGSVEDERLFSAASFVLGKYRRRLDVSLEKCVRMKVQNLFTLENFPFDKALKKWNEACSIRGRYHG